MAVRLGGATSSCLCSPLGRSACTNKLNQGLWSNGNQTCPPSHFPPPCAGPKHHRRALQLKDALQLSQTDLKIFPLPLHPFPTLQRFVTFRASTSAVTFLTPEQPDSPNPRLSPLSLTFTCLLYRSSFPAPPSCCTDDDGFIGTPRLFPRKLQRAQISGER